MCSQIWTLRYAASKLHWKWHTSHCSVTQHGYSFLPGQNLSVKQDTSTFQTYMQILNSYYLTGVLGLPKKRRGDRIFGSNENFSLTFSNTDGATYVKPFEEEFKKKKYKHIHGVKEGSLVLHWYEERMQAYQEDLICTFAECGVIGAIYGSLAGELRIKLAHVLSGLLRKQKQSSFKITLMYLAGKNKKNNT